MEDFSTAPETQNEAFQLIEQFLADEEGFQSLEAERKADVGDRRLGPRRVEVLIQERKPTRLPAKRKRLLVTSVLEPSGHFQSHVVSGREWISLEKRELSDVVVNFNSDIIDIIELFIYDEGSIYKEEAEPFTTEPTKQSTAWKRLLREHGRLEHVEKVQLTKWDGVVGMSPAVTPPAPTYPDVDPDDDYGYGWINRTPSTYKPSPPHRAYFRVAGDNVGAELLQKHRQKLLETKMEIVVVPDRIPEEPKVLETKPVAKVPKPGLPIVFKPEDDFQKCYCGLPGCDNCHLTSILAETMMPKGGRYNVH